MSPVIHSLPAGSTVVLRALPSAGSDRQLATSAVTAIGRALDRELR